MERSKTLYESSDLNQLLLVSLHTDLFKKFLEEHCKNSNKINKPLAQSLSDIVDLISNFIDSANVIVEENELENEQEEDLNSILKPAIENSTLQLRCSFFCNVCKQDVNKTLLPKLTQHFLKEKHLKNLRKYANQLENIPDLSQTALPQNTLSDNEGSTQSLNELETKNHLAQHQKQKPPKQRLNSLPARMKDVVPRGRLPKKMSQFLEEGDLEKFTNDMLRVGAAVANQRKHNRVCDMLRRKLSGKYPKVKTYSFGSFGIGLGDERSDLDIFIDIDNCFYKKLPKHKMKDAIFNIQRILSNAPNEWGDFSPVTKARTPILRVYCRAENIDCDLSFSNGLSTCNTNLVAYYTALQPLCKKLIIFIKYWAALLNFGVNSYMWALMVIFYLQQENALPSVKTLQDKVQPIFIDEWNVGFGTPNLQQLKMPLITDFRQHLTGFFRFYAHQFDFTNYIICTLTGTRVPKHIFDHGKEFSLPPVFRSYVEYMKNIDIDEANEIDDLFANFKPLVIQDPFELIHNVGKGVQEQKLMKIIHYMRNTLEILMKRQH